mmetsp:Transcript_34292/g.109517  ORF Transcript_34292/g.109517 Transcript_34292/m.109517 type:complete len:237 (-) Transcript_34292:76-786(-)
MPKTERTYPRPTSGARRTEPKRRCMAVPVGELKKSSMAHFQSNRATSAGADPPALSHVTVASCHTLHVCTRRLALTPEEATPATTCSACDAQLLPGEVASTNPTLGSHCCRQSQRSTSPLPPSSPRSKRSPRRSRPPAASRPRPARRRRRRPRRRRRSARPRPSPRRRAAHAGSRSRACAQVRLRACSESKCAAARALARTASVPSSCPAPLPRVVASPMTTSRSRATPSRCLTRP